MKWLTTSQTPIQVTCWLKVVDFTSVALYSSALIIAFVCGLLEKSDDEVFRPAAPHMRHASTPYQHYPHPNGKEIWNHFLIFVVHKHLICCGDF